MSQSVDKHTMLIFAKNVRCDMGWLLLETYRLDFLKVFLIDAVFKALGKYPDGCKK